MFDFFIGICYTLVMEKTIASISTPLGKGAIAIIRMSGKNCLQVTQKFFSAKNLDYKNVTPRHMYLGEFKVENNSEKCLMVYFKAPNSYTGEDMVEFQVHGGTLLTQKILECLLGGGAVLAEPGEFSRLAFENGKISLDEAESIIGEINAESDNELSAALALAGGKLKDKVKIIQNDLTEKLAEIEATLDYPEEDFESEVKDNLYKMLSNIYTQIEEIVRQSKNAGYINNGIKVAIVGAPNVGKSSLLNAVLGQERAIVTEIEGTTRDTISESIMYKGIKLNFVDTAGIRETEDKVESIGVEKSKKMMEQSDIVLFVLDGSKVLTKEDKVVLSLVQKFNHIIVVNKSDKERVLQALPNEINISALEKVNIEVLLELIYNKVITEEIDFNKIVVTNERQIVILTESQNILQKLLENKDESMDLVSMQIKKLWNELGKITGDTENERIIDLIFSKFCLGK